MSGLTGSQVRVPPRQPRSCGKVAALPSGDAVNESPPKGAPLILAIDPGLEGGIATVRGPDASAIPLPHTNNGLPDVKYICQLVRKCKVRLVYIEGMGESKSAKTLRTQASHWGMLCAAIVMPGARPVVISPKAWIRALVPEGTGGDKAPVAKMVRAHWPKGDFDDSHTGQTDALGIAMYVENHLKRNGLLV